MFLNNHMELCEAISLDFPVGIDLRKDLSSESIYYKIKDLRNHARSIERQNLGELDPNHLQDWQQIIDLSEEVLRSKSKDLDICAWYLEALLRVEHFKGLAHGFRLIAELCNRYWDKIYPLPDQEGIITRLSLLANLNGIDSEGALIFPIKCIPITQGISEGPFSLWQYQYAVAHPKKVSTANSENVEDNLSIDMAKFNIALSQTESGFFKQLIEDLNSCTLEFENLCQVLESKCGKDAPPSSQIHEILASTLSTVKFITKGIMDVKEEQHLDFKEVSHVANNININVIKNRDDAFATLERVSDFFLNTEPHSPLAYIIKKAVRWGKMSLPELLDEMIDDDGAKINAFVLAGIEVDEE